MKTEARSEAITEISVEKESREKTGIKREIKVCGGNKR